MYKVILIVFVLFVLCGNGFGAGDLCLEKYVEDIKRYSFWYFGVEYPYWYSLGLIKTESRCVWRRSLDGLGSVGVGQITVRFWDIELRKQGLEFYKEEGHEHHAGAICYILSKVYESAVDLCYVCNNCHKRNGIIDKKRLWIVYQGYNRNIVKLNREVVKAGSCDWERWKEVCNEVDVCVWRNKDGSCRQWRNGCEINSEYSKKVYESGIFYKRTLGINSRDIYVFY